MKSFLSHIKESHIHEAKKGPKDPPAVMIMRRKSIRQFPNGQRVAIYYIEALKKYVSVPYDETGTGLGMSGMSENEEIKG
jgi:hypothetical protein